MAFALTADSRLLPRPLPPDAQPALEPPIDIHDWLPFALILVVYDLSRGAATLIGTPTLWQIQPKIDRSLFVDTEPTVWLQEHLKLPDPPWWEVVISTIYMSFFILPYVVAG